ncbi:hypothetical protein L1987_76848 [Smallanthus sonchifolius]|uniref:Uncharacterized protein n=1 Tax=Smallanthus sonchifolius TaxID=185202 RepID=A0ACB8Z8J9_9ASTR|nr:hypothetical protein L1987_76848 [Smallanthus sonchifolius]
MNKYGFFLVTPLAIEVDPHEMQVIANQEENMKNGLKFLPHSHIHLYQSMALTLFNLSPPKEKWIPFLGINFPPSSVTFIILNES